MTWTLLSETGMVYGPDAPGDERLRFPVMLEQAPDATYLIVDEIALHKNLTIRAECRTLRVAPDGDILFDSVALGRRDAFGCLMDDGQWALLRRTSWEIEVLAASGEVVRTLDLSSFTRRMARFISWTPRRSFLMACFDSVYDVDLLEVDEHGRLLWFLPRTKAVGCPSSAQLTSDDRVLMADEFGHVVVELDRNGSIAWQYGEKKNPSPALGMVSNPTSARRTGPQSHLIADTRNHRVLSVSSGATTVLSLPFETCCPSFVAQTPDGGYLLCDAGNERVLSLDSELAIRWQFGRAVADQRNLSYPRSVEPTGNGAVVVADTAHDRVVTITNEEAREWPVDDETPLFWPRCARVTSAGNLLVADGRNSRIVEVSASGEALHRLDGVELGEHRTLEDPHDVRELDNGRLLITDAAQDLVVETDWNGNVSWMANGGPATGLKDPHSAQKLADGTVLIADTGRSRIVWVDASGTIIRELHGLHSRGFHWRFNLPRYAELTPDRGLLIVDSGNNRVLGADENGELLWELSDVPDSRLQRLSQPRWAQFVGDDELIVSDHSNHRIIRLRYQPDS